MGSKGRREKGASVKQAAGGGYAQGRGFSEGY